jgi:imidazolonepropionase
MLALGVTTVEAKSGYGLSTGEETRVLRLYRDLDDAVPQAIVPAFLGAHTVPPEYAERRAAYVDLVVDEMIPRVAEEGLARFCDVFLEEGAFGRDEARRILEAGSAAGLRPKLHADQLSDGGGAALGAELGAASVDHLEEISEDGIAALAASDTVAVLLPLATLYLGQRPPPARRLVDAGVPVAVATDFNPGSAPSHHLPLALTLACTLLGLAPAEAVKGATLQAARALDLEETVGSLESGKRADLAIVDAPDEDHWLYHFRANACRCVVAGGEVAWTSS